MRMEFRPNWMRWPNRRERPETLLLFTQSKSGLMERSTKTAGRPRFLRMRTTARETVALLTSAILATS